MLARLLFLFVAVPLLELVILIQLGRLIGLWPTLGIVAGTGVVGASLARSQGVRTWRAFQREVAAGRMPGREIFDGVAILAGGALLLTPGIVTDLAGFLLLVPATRALIRRRAARALERRIAEGSVRLGIFIGGPPR